MIGDMLLSAVGIILCYTGEVTLFLVTFGRRRPDWGAPLEAEIGEDIFRELSFYVGILIWIGLLALL